MQTEKSLKFWFSVAEGGKNRDTKRTMATAFDHVDYDALDRAKMAFIKASQRTLQFAKEFGFLPDESLGASANVFSLNLKPFLQKGVEELFITLIPEGLGTADDARPKDLNSEELIQFWFNIGIKTVAVMTNDAASSGMQPILISLYLPSARPDLMFSEEFMQGFLDGFVEGCRRVQCVYFSGETPQLKSKLYEDKLDIAGAVFGLIPPGQSPIASRQLEAGDTIVFVESSGPHENGFTTLRKLAENLPQGYRSPLPSGRSYWEAINAPSHLYSPLIQNILKEGINPTNVEPISGHGWQKLMRSQKSLRYHIETVLPVPEIFQYVEEHLKMNTEEMIKVFNYGTGLAIFLRTREEAERVIALCQNHKLSAIIAGRVEPSEHREVFVEPWAISLKDESFLLKK